jgi:hypothetical protein
VPLSCHLALIAARLAGKLYFLDSNFGDHVTDIAGKDLTPVSRRQKVISGLRGRRFRGELAPTYGAAAILSDRYISIHTRTPSWLMFFLCAKTGGRVSRE